MAFIKWILLIPLSFAMMLVGWSLAPILPLFADETGYLPRWLWWFQTPDNPIDGDRGHLKRWEGKPVYIRRVAWLLRNCCYGFDESVCGVHTYPTDTLVEIGEVNASDVRGISGACWRTMYRGSKMIAWHWYFVQHYTFWKFKACVRIGLGWKLWNPECFHKQFTCYFHPFKKARWEK